MKNFKFLICHFDFLSFIFSLSKTYVPQNRYRRASKRRKIYTL